MKRYENDMVTVFWIKFMNFYYKGFNGFRSMANNDSGNISVYFSIYNQVIPNV